MDKIFTLGRWSPGRVYSIPIHCYFTVGMLLVVYCYKFISRRAAGAWLLAARVGARSNIIIITHSRVEVSTDHGDVSVCSRASNEGSNGEGTMLN